MKQDDLRWKRIAHALDGATVELPLSFDALCKSISSLSSKTVKATRTASSEGEAHYILNCGNVQTAELSITANGANTLLGLVVITNVGNVTHGLQINPANTLLGLVVITNGVDYVTGEDSTLREDRTRANSIGDFVAEIIRWAFDLDMQPAQAEPAQTVKPKRGKNYNTAEKIAKARLAIELKKVLQGVAFDFVGGLSHHTFNKHRDDPEVIEIMKQLRNDKEFLNSLDGI